MEALRDREQAARLRRRIAIIGDIGAVNDPRQARQRSILDRVLLKQYLERAQAVAVGVPRTRRVV